MEPTQTQLTLMDGMILDYVAEGKSPRQIADILGISAAEVSKRAYELLDKEIVTDIEQRRKLQVYRLEKIIEALWQRVMRNAERDDVKNLVDTLDKLNTLLALNKEQDAEMQTRMFEYQAVAYQESLMGLIMAFRMIAPDAMTEDEWSDWAAEQLTMSMNKLRGIEE